jgi:hypothetical protein
MASMISFLALNMVENFLHYRIGRGSSGGPAQQQQQQQQQQPLPPLPPMHDIAKMAAIMAVFAVLQGALTLLLRRWLQ